MKKALFTVISCAALLAQAQTKDATKSPATTATKSDATKKAPAATKAAGGPNLMDPTTLRATAPATFDVKMTTTKGEVVIRVTRAWAPNGADHFYNLVRAGFYTNAAFFRVISGFMAQFGISARPEVSKIWANRNIPDDRVVEHNTRGKVTYAQTGAPNSRSTQLFINYGDNSRLDADRFAPFGEVISGMEVVDNFYAGYGEGAPGGRGPDQGRLTAEGKPYLDRDFPMLDRIISATIVPAAPAAAPAAPAAGKAADTKKQ